MTQTIHEALRKVSGNEGITIEKDEYDADHGQVIRKTSITTGWPSCCPGLGLGT